MKKTLTILVASSLLLGFGCYKKGEVAFDAVYIGQEASSGDWEKGVINSLLKYVSADSAMVYASTRGFDLSSPAMIAYLKKHEKVLRDRKDALRHADAADQAKIFPFYDALIDLSANFEQVAPDWGLDPKGRADSILYMTERKIVAKLTLRDGKKAKAKVRALLKSFQDLIVMDIDVDNENWLLINGGQHDSLTLALHFEDTTLTAGLLFNVAEELDYLNNLLKPSDMPMSKEDFGKLSAQTAGIGFIDNVKILSLSVNPSSDLAKLIKRCKKVKASESCLSEWKTIAEAFPRIDFEATADKSYICINSVLKLRDGEGMPDLQSLLDKGISLKIPQSLADFIASLDIDTSISVLSKRGKTISQKPYSCEELGFIKQSPSSMAGVSMRNNDRLFKCVDCLSDLSVSLKSIKFFNRFQQLSTLAYFIGHKMTKARKLAKGMFSHRFKPFKALKLKEDVAASFDISDLVDAPLVLRTRLTDNGLVIDTDGDGEDDDVSIGNTYVSKVSNTMIKDVSKLRLNYNVYSMVETSATMHYTFDLNIGVVSNSIRLRTVIHF